MERVARSAPNPAPRVTRAAIVDIASGLFQEHGYHATSLEHVAKALGVTRPALYHYFRSKQDILYEIHRTAQARLGAAMDHVHAQHLDPVPALQRLLYNHVVTIAENAQMVACFFQEEAGLPARRRAQFRQARWDYTRAFADVYEAGVKTGSFVDIDPLLATFVMLGACNWISTWYKTDRWDPAEIASAINRMALRGMLTDSGRLETTEAASG